jgi:putative alpha-1,2-mannosidase
VQSISLNGNPHTDFHLTHDLILEGGVMEFEMGERRE